MESYFHHKEITEYLTTSRQTEANFDQSTENTCRICYEIADDENPLISPCKCSGSMKYIHEHCLKIWLLSIDEDLDKGKCDICKVEFIMDFEIVTECSCTKIKEGTGSYILPPILLLALAILAFLIFFLISKISFSENNQFYIVFLLTICAIISVIIFLILIRSIKRTFLITNLKNWTIYSQDFKNEEKETIENSMSVITDSPGIDNEGQNVIIISKSPRVKGKPIVLPQINTNNLIPIMQDDQIVGYKSRQSSPVTSRQSSGVYPRVQDYQLQNQNQDK
ncbi:unnamed protein product [Blepharisma stoltei]|uniref:RING-CH-type domain-containing protein n=1 Tax=Blepharisma stoltei TaxID=1481888 RepID=A0AAU9IW84_9CILI|nr:unnamed protein product [Blepharisma stoltei]